jgi:rRNA-processing protein FCF1
MDFDSLILRYSQKGILVDTNILLLYFVGKVNRERITRFKRTEQFLAEDFDILLRLLNLFAIKFTTPNILTEVSNLINQLSEPERTQCYAILSQEVLQFSETYIESSKASFLDSFVRFGLTDSCIQILAKDNYLVLTDDFKLASHLRSDGVAVINFNHIRSINW